MIFGNRRAIFNSWKKRWSCQTDALGEGNGELDSAKRTRLRRGMAPHWISPANFFTNHTYATHLGNVAYILRKLVRLPVIKAVVPLAVVMMGEQDRLRTRAGRLIVKFLSDPRTHQAWLAETAARGCLIRWPGSAMWARYPQPN